MSTGTGDVHPVPYPPAGNLTRTEILERACKLVSRVWDHFDPAANEANDCFCGVGRAMPVNDEHYRSSGQAIAWLEALVMRELDRCRQCGGELAYAGAVFCGAACSAEAEMKRPSLVRGPAASGQKETE